MNEKQQRQKKRDQLISFEIIFISIVQGKNEI